MTKFDLLLAEFFQRLVWFPLRLLSVIFCSLQIKGSENLKKVKNNVIFASNHSNELDPLLLVACLPFFSRHFPIIYVTREKKLYGGAKWKQVVYGGVFFKIIGGYPSYVGLKDYKIALRNHFKALSLGQNVGIFPTGRKVRRGDEVKAKGGVSFLSHKSKRPIIPVSMQGLEDLNPKNFFSGKKSFTIAFGKPLYPKDIFKNPKVVVINNRRNDYEVAAAVVMNSIQKLND